jgi:hypothetical protein
MIYFLSGLPRSGSTVLSAILNQNPKIYSTATSGLIELLGAVCLTWENSPTTKASGEDEAEAYRMLKSVIASKYENIKKPIIIDKNRGWVNPQIIETMTNVLGFSPKIIATVRSTSDCAASFIRVAKPENVSDFLRNSSLIQHLKSSYAELKQGYHSCPENILFIDYDDLLKNPQEQLDKIHNFLGIEPFIYDFNNIDTEIVSEQDELAWGVSGLHKISPQLKKQHNENSKDILAQHFDSYDQPKFWKGEERVDKKKKIDISVELSMRGNFEESYKVLCEAQNENPLCNKIAFNMGWYALRHNKLQEGMENLAKGRFENCFGNKKPNVPTPIWDGKKIGTVLYYLEGGLGDQIHALKYIKDINKRGCDVIVACSAELFPIVRCCVGVKMIIEHAAAGGVYHDFWCPAMSVLIPLGYEYKDIDGTPYISKTNSPKNKIPVIGVRWQGNPKFEHEQNRKFPLDPFFDSLKNVEANFVCLQRDEGEEHCPEFIKKVPLNTWGQTRDVMSSCDLVISSCTSVAHLSGAMGVETWIIVPVLNYYIWSFPGDKSPYYDSVRLFRQKTFGCWDNPIMELKKSLETKFGIKNKGNKLCKNMLE